MDSVEKQLNLLEQEANAQKVAYEQTATTLPVYTVSVNFATSRNELTTDYGGGATRKEDWIERTVVIFDTENGANTLATLEIETNASSAPSIRRTPYKGGARWVIANRPRTESGNWRETNYRFQIQSLIKGSLRAESMSS